MNYFRGIKCIIDILRRAAIVFAMKNDKAIKICVLDEDPMHLIAIEALVAESDIVDLTHCRASAISEGGCCSGSLDLLLFNMEGGIKCDQFHLLNILENISEVPVICYTIKGWISPHIKKLFDSRLILLSYAELLTGLSEYVGSLVKQETSPSITGLDFSGAQSIPLGFERLTPKELDMMCLLGKGHGVLEIAAILNRSTNTVESHIKNIRLKLSLKATIDLRYAAHRFSQTGYCRVFSNHTDHLCPYQNTPVGCCPHLKAG